MTDQYSTVAKTMMEGMGWKDGDGLGKHRQGRTNALKPRKKIDNSGLGAKRTAGKWLDACCAYDDILQKLNVAYGDDAKEPELDKKERKRRRKEEKKRRRAAECVEESDDAASKENVASADRKKSKKSKKSTREERVVEETEAADESDTDASSSRPVPVARHLIYAKRLKAKQVEGYSASHKAEIFASIQRQVRTEQKRKEKYAAPPADSPAETSADEPEPVGVHARQGFTEDTQVDIYNAAMDKQIKGRTGLGVGKRLSKGKRREAASAAHHLTRIGRYLSTKFVSAGTLEQVHAKV